MVGSGLLTYAFLVLAARTLGPDAYGRIGVLWVVMFIGAIVLFRPLEQTASRSIADRRARGEEVRSVIRSVVFLGTCALAVTAIVSFFAWSFLTEKLFGGEDRLTVFLLIGIAAYGCSYVVRGLVGGVMWFDGYGVNLIADGLSRLVLALPLLVFASDTVAAVAIAGAGFFGALMPVLFGRRRLRPLLAQAAGHPFRTRRALRFAAPASSIAAADQLIVNGGPLFVIVSGGPHATRNAGVAFAATMLVRAPVYVFQGVAAAILPNLASLNASAGYRRLKREVARTSAALAAVGVVVVAACCVLGPFGMRLLYGDEYQVSRFVFVGLGVGIGLYLVAATLSQSLLAIDSGARAALAWLAAALALISSYVFLPGGEITRVAMSFAVACGVLLFGLTMVLYVGARSER